MKYIIKVNTQKYHTGITISPLTRNIVKAKQYSKRKFAENDAVKLITRHRYICRVEIVELTAFLNGE